MTVPSGAVLLALAWCPCQPGKSIVWSISFISSVNENIPLMFPPLPDLAQMQINPFNSSPSALMELGGCDKWKMFISFLISQSPKVGPLPRVPWLGIHEKAKDSSDAWSCYHLHCLNWKPCFLLPASPQKLFPLSSEDFTAFKACRVIFLTTRSEVWGKFYKRLVWEKEGRLREIGSLCQAGLAGNVFPNELMHTGALLHVLLLPSAVLLFLSGFPAPFWELVKCVFLSWCLFQQVPHHTHEHMLVWSFSGARRPRRNTKSRHIFKGLQWQGGPLLLLSKDFCNPAVVGGRNSKSRNSTQGSQLALVSVSVTLCVQHTPSLRFFFCPFCKLCLLICHSKHALIPSLSHQNKRRGAVVSLWNTFCSRRTRCSALLRSGVVLFPRRAVSMQQIWGTLVFDSPKYSNFSHYWRLKGNFESIRTIQSVYGDEA